MYPGGMLPADSFVDDIGMSTEVSFGCSTSDEHINSCIAWQHQTGTCSTQEYVTLRCGGGWFPIKTYTVHESSTCPGISKRGTNNLVTFLLFNICRGVRGGGGASSE